MTIRDLSVHHLAAKLAFISLCVGCVAAYSVRPALAQGQPQRSVIMIVYDDLFNVYKYRNKFGVTLQTPNFDRLAARGVTFRNAHASVAVCNPSRTSFMTGLSPYRTGVFAPEPIQWHEQFDPEDTIVGAMRTLGFRTAATGKVFHNSTNGALGDFYRTFHDRYFQTRYRERDLPGTIAHPKGPNEQLADDLNLGWAKAELSNYNHPSPLFMTIGVFKPHRPLVAPPEFFAMYPQAQIQLPSDPVGDLADVSQFYKDFRLLENYHSQLVNQGLTKQFVQGYLAAASYADAKLGELLNAIDANPRLNNATIIVFSDHGFQLGEKLTWNKQTLWEEATNVPLVVVDPALTPGSAVDTPVSLLNIFPTCIEAAGSTPTEQLDGTSLFDVVLNPQNHTTDVALTTMMGSVSLRNSRYRLILHNDGSRELYDIQLDLAQRNNLVSDPTKAVLLEQLTARLAAEVRNQGGRLDLSTANLNGTANEDAIFAIGAQTASGGLGDDTYFVVDGATVVEQPQGGLDVVYFADYDFRFPLHVEVARNHPFSNSRDFVVTGNSGANRLELQSARGQVSMLAGNDVVIAGGARDNVDGGDGNDYIENEAGNGDLLIGGFGGDSINGGAGAEVIHGDRQTQVEVTTQGDMIFADGLRKVTAGALLPNGDVRLNDNTIAPASTVELKSFAGELSDKRGPLPIGPIQQALTQFGLIVPDDFVVLSTVGVADQITAGGGPDLVMGQAGNDIINAGEGNNVVWGGIGNDRITSGGGVDRIHGGDGIDDVRSGAGPDMLFGEAGDDLLQGDAGNDELDGGTENDRLNGGLGNDRLFGDRGIDELIGGAGDDYLDGGPGPDLLLGSPGNDQLHGADNGDQLNGEDGTDSLFGGNGNDQLEGGADNDTLTGGADADLFIFLGILGTDTLTDFQVGVDKIQIGVGTPLHSLTPQVILSDFATQSGADVQLGYSGRFFLIRNVTVATLVNSFQY